MTAEPRAFPDAMPHGTIEEAFPNVYVVKGTAKPPTTPVTVCISRNMTIVKQTNGNEDELALINTIRLNETDLAELDKLGKVKHIIRIGGYHGMDDAFYVDRYKDTTLWSVEKNYFAGFDSSSEPYMQADNLLTEDSKLPIKDATLHIIQSSTPKEGLILLKNRAAEGANIMVSGDCLQNLQPKGDKYFNFAGGWMMWFMGFLKPHNIGPGWYAGAKAKKQDVLALLDLDFEHVIPGHGEICVGGATKKYETAAASLKEQ
jgi:hypothetical protein